MSTAAPRRTRPRGETRREQILDAATAVFLKHGYAGATIELVVARAGASKATIYSFFGDKEGLFTALVDERAGRILAGFPDVEVGTVDVPTALAEIARQYMAVAMSPEAIGLYRLILAEGPRFPELVERVYRVGHERVAAGVAQALRTWAGRGRISADDPDRLATQLLDIVRGDLHLRLVAGVRPDDLAEAIESNIVHGVRTFWRAVGPRGGERGRVD
jgi:AcrR family transcriptional regulator